MQYTANYNLITVEGTDVVNPLVQMNPNFTDIDAAMFANKQAVIGSASEIVSGTVHAITRANPDSDYFRYTATGNWTSGDTMSVDGVTVSVYLTDGTTPATGSYIINSEVFGMISGSRVTLYLANPKVNDIGDLTTLDTTDKTSLVNAINEVYGMAGGNSVSITTDGVRSISQNLDALFAQIDPTKMTPNSKLVIGTGVYVLYTLSSGVYQFVGGRVSTANFAYRSLVIRNTSSTATIFVIDAGGTSNITNESATVESAGIVYQIVY